MLQRCLHEGGDAPRNTCHHIGNLAVLHEHLNAALVGIRDGWLHDFHALCQRGLFLGHCVDEGLPLQQDFRGHKVAVLLRCGGGCLLDGGRCGVGGRCGGLGGRCAMNGGHQIPDFQDGTLGRCGGGEGGLSFQRRIVRRVGRCGGR